MPDLGRPGKQGRARPWLRARCEKTGRECQLIITLIIIITVMIKIILIIIIIILIIIIIIMIVAIAVIAQSASVCSRKRACGGVLVALVSFSMAVCMELQ